MWYPAGKQHPPAISLRSSTLNDSLNKDAQFLQACISTNTHPDDTDPQAVFIWKHKTPQISSVILCIFISVQRSSQSNPKWLLLTMSTILWNMTEYVNMFSINWKNKETSTSKTWNNFYKNVKNGGEMPSIHPCPVLIIQMLLVLHNRE